MRFILRLFRTKGFFLSFCLLLATGLLLAEGTRTWEQWKFEDLIKGTSQGVAILSNGGLELAPAFKALSTTPSTYIWSIAADREGNVYAAAGSPARVYRITPDGKWTAIFEPQELQVQALVVAKDGTIFAATNPDGKIYKIEHRSGSQEKPSQEKTKSTVADGWTASVYFDPGTKYIWDLALDNTGDLFIATGDQGQIFRVAANGDHSVFFKSDEAHIRVLAFDAKGNLIAGSDGSGLIYRIDPKGSAFVLYSAPKKEITALAIDRDGNIFAAGVGEKRSEGGAASFSIPSVSIPVTVPSGGVQTANPVTPAVSSPLISLPSTAAAAGGSEIYRIAPDGSPARVWASHDDLVYALAFDQGGQLLAGTGNRGHIFAIGKQDQFTDLLKASASQVTAFAPAPGGGLYASTSNLGKLFLLSAASAPEGSYESDVFDAHIFSRWGRAEFRGEGNVQLFARGGNVDNPDRNWSAWKAIDLQKDAPIDVPPARFIQWKAVLKAGSPAPRVDSVTINYLPKNVAPEFDDVSVQVGTRYQGLPKVPGSDTAASHFDTPPTSTHDRDSIGVKWSAHDDNDDQMVYSIYYRGDGQSRWLLLKSDVTDKFYSFDASLLPDGGYKVKVVASDAPSHSPGQGLTAERESARFVVDTTPPLIEDLKASVEGGQIHVTFRAKDSFSPIKRAEYSIDAGDWQFVEPVDHLSDSKIESYDFTVPVPSESSSSPQKNVAGIEHVVVVRGYDRFDNMSAAKTVIRGK
jgi:sugar lactone lactonase YvrE